MEQLDPIPLNEQQAMLKHQPGSSRMALEDQALAAYHKSGNKQDYFDVFNKYYANVERHNNTRRN